MNRILCINPTGRFSYAKHHTVQLDKQGAVLLQGRNLDRGGNVRIGAGKSSLFNSICDILFGQSQAKLSGDDVINDVWGRGCWGLVTFIDNNGEKWRVINCRKWKSSEPYPDPSVDSEPSQIHDQGKRYSGTEVFLERWEPTDGKWYDERPTNAGGTPQLRQKQTYAKISQVLGMSYTQFVTTSYVAQKMTSRFIEGAHKDRLAVLSGLMDLSVWDRASALAKEKAAEAEKALLEANARASVHANALLRMNPPSDEEIASAQAQLDAIGSAMESIGRQVNELSAQLKSMLSVGAEDDGRERELQAKYRDAVAAAAQAEHTFRYGGTTFQQQRVAAQQSVSTSRVLKAQGNIASIKQELQYAKMEQGGLLESAGKCPRCKQDVSDTHLARERRIIGEKVDDLTFKLAEAEAEHQEAQQEYQKAVAAAIAAVDEQERVWREQAEKAWHDLEKVRDDIQASIDAMQKARQQRGQAAREAEERLSALRAQYEEHASSHAGWKRHVERLRADLARANEEREKLEQARNDAKEKTTELAYYKALDRSFGDKGIKAFKMAVLVDKLNHLLRQYLYTITEGMVHVWVDAFRTKKDGDVTADIQIYVREGEKKNVPIEGYSGGEQEQIMMAFVCAFWSLATQYGGGTNILLLDEAFTALDEHSVGLIMMLLDQLRTGKVSTIMLVTHDPKVQNLMKFDQTWTVVKENGMSRLEVT